MEIDFALAKESLGYQTSTDPSNTNKRLLIAGSQNVLIDQQKKTRIRPGYTRLGPANSALTPITSGFRWDTSTGIKHPQRIYNGVLESYLTTVDSVAINAWAQIYGSFSTTGRVRAAQQGGVVTPWYDATEGIDLELLVQGDDSVFEWNGAVAVVASIGAATITKAGTDTFAQARFYHTRNKVVRCVRTGTDYTYTGGESTTTLTGFGTTVGLVAGDILVQKVVTIAQGSVTSGWPAGRTNDVAYVFQNQLCIGSFNDPIVYISKNTAYANYAYSTPRIAGEGALLTLNNPIRALNSLGAYLLAFAGPDTIFRADYQQVAVGATLAETLNVQKFDVGTNKGALNQESVISTGNQLAYLTNEVAVRTISNIQNLTGIDPKTLSDPIKPDFDAETWTDAGGVFYKNTLEFYAPASSKLYMLNYSMDPNGRVERYWNPPQILPITALTIFDAGSGEFLYGHSNAVPETYLLFDGLSDGQYANMDVADKIAIHAIAKFAYDDMGKPERLKTFDEYAVKGEITPNTPDLLLSLDYDFEGYTQFVQRTINGTDEDILQGSVSNNSLAQSLLALQPLGGLLTPPANARRFNVIFEIAKEDYTELSATFETNDVDRYWSIIAHGPNATLSPRRPINIHK